VLADFFGRMGEVEFDRPTATRLEVYEQQPLLRGEHVARVRLTARIGQLALADMAAGLSGPVHVFYRPEDVQLSHTTAGTPTGASLTAHVERIVRTRRLAHVTLDCDPPVTALMFHRDIERLHLTAGDPVQVSLPSGSVRIFQTGAGP
jgi:hypothetical protein